MSPIAREVEKYYQKGMESERLSGLLGELERLRTQAILVRNLPPAPSVILDVGGAARVYAVGGAARVYASPLAGQGYRVHLIDPVELHLQQARDHSAKSGVALASITRGDARSLDFPSACADAVLLLGPLYHLAEYADRLQALREARRVLAPHGVLFAAAISRFASLIDGLSSGYFRDAEFRKIVAADLASGLHRNPTNNPAYFTTAYFHRPEDLAAELRDAGFSDAQVLAVEGPVWSAAHLQEAWSDPAERKNLMEFLALIEREPSVLGASAHLIAVARIAPAEDAARP
jgi:ubiquinone/menaquinone biosynthesis C-methylase UbiE